MGVSYERLASARVRGVDGSVTGRVQVTKNASGGVHLRVLQDVRVDGRPIGTDDPRWALVARFAVTV